MGTFTEVAGLRKLGRCLVLDKLDAGCVLKDLRVQYLNTDTGRFKRTTNQDFERFKIRVWELSRRREKTLG